MRISDWSSDVCSSDLVRVGEYDRRLRADQLRRLQDVASRALLDPEQPLLGNKRDVHDRGQAEVLGEVLHDLPAGAFLELDDQLVAGDQRRIKALGVEYEPGLLRSEEHTSELQSLMRISYAVFC